MRRRFFLLFGLLCWSAGALPAAEIPATVQTLFLAGPSRDEFLEAVMGRFGEADRDGDGIIILGDPPGPLAAGGPQGMLDIARRLDPNRDGVLTSAEMRALALSWFAAADRNADLLVDGTERAAFARTISSP